ncbi:MAG: DUF1016 N-terminal domain-containing protein, partial [Candidatus Sumerlaeota bacterium]|nr:DUF1016 N-terminal domain-containing protein [Candidatus Sumerlaeota bacterium]
MSKTTKAGLKRRRGAHKGADLEKWEVAVRRRKPESPRHLASNDTARLYQRIRELIIAARQTVARGVDLVQVHTNFEIGRHIVEHEQQGEHRADYGKEVIKALADRLMTEFGNGFSKSNLEYMRRFYLAYEDRGHPIAQTASGQLATPNISQTTSGQLAKPKSQTASGQLHNQTGMASVVPFKIVQTASGQSASPFSLSWSHYVFLLGIKNLSERSFYEIEAAQEGWTLRELKRQFDISLYERL